MPCSCGDLSVEDESIANFQEVETEVDFKLGPTVDSHDDFGQSLDELDLSRLSFDTIVASDMRREEKISSMAFDERQKYQSQKAQLNLIFDLIGTPEVEQLRFLDVKNRAMLLTMEHKPRKNFKAMYPSASDSCIELLLSFLQFDPDMRITPAEAITHPFFDGIKAQGYLNGHKVDSEKETGATVSPQSGSTDCDETDCLAPLNAEREKNREAPVNLRRNVRIFSLFMCSMILQCSYFLVRFGDSSLPSKKEGSSASVVLRGIGALFFSPTICF